MGMAYEMIGRLFSRSQMRKLGSLLEASGLDFVPEAFAGFIVIICAFASLFTYFLVISLPAMRSVVFRLSMSVSQAATSASPEFFTAIAFALSAALMTLAICLIAYVALMLAADARKRKVDEILPDFLSLSAANVRAGMTIDQAMWYSAKPDFGILSVEVATVAKKTFGGVPFNQAIDHLAERFNSKSVKRAVALIKQGIASGGKLADILERTAEESRQLQILRKEISASLLMYIIFVVFAGAVGTPFLFAVSGKLVSMIEGVFVSLPAQSTMSAAAGFGSTMMVPTKPAISSADFFIFTVLSCAITAFFSSLIIGVISKGNKREGLLYLPFVLLCSLLVFLAVSFALDSFLSGIAM